MTRKLELEWEPYGTGYKTEWGPFTVYIKGRSVHVDCSIYGFVADNEKGAKGQVEEVLGKLIKTVSTPNGWAKLKPDPDGYLTREL